MLALIDESLEAFLRATVPLSAVDIDVSFEAPDDEWAAKLTRPTVNLHLWDVRRSNSRAFAGTEDVERNGVVVRRAILPRAELSFYVTVWTSEHEDERTLISALLIALLGHSQIPDQFIANLADIPSPELRIAQAGDSDVFTLESRLKLGLQLKVTSAIDIGAGEPLAKAVGEISISLSDRSTGAADPPMRRIAGEVLDPAAAGATVRSPLAVAIVNEAGRFLINARPGDEIVVETEPPQMAIVPPIGGVVVRT